MNKLGPKSKLRRKRRMLTGVVDQLDNNINKRRRQNYSRAPPGQLVRLGDSVQDFIDRTGISRATAYRMMGDGRLKFIQITSDLRRIPTSEYVRLGFVTDVREVA